MSSPLRSHSPRVSLLASTYRSEGFLPTWFESIQSQTLWPETELIIVANDPSPAEDRLLQSFSDRHQQVSVLTVDREPLYRSWNRAVAASSAPLLGIANVDDLRMPKGLETQAESMEANRDALFCYGSYASSTEFPPPALTEAVVEAPEFDTEEFTRSMLLGPFFIWRRSKDSTTRYFDEQLKVGGDFDLAIRLALNGSGIRVAENLGWYYNGGSGLSTGGEAQPVERTVIELRYGIYDKLDFRYVPQAVEYVIPQLLQPGDTWLPVADVVPDYESFLRDRQERWFRPPRPGLSRWWRRQIT
jgi:glycosyltransferase involved in cell wall biosynthesis